MGPDSTTYEALVLVEVEGDEAADVYLMPLATLRADYDYRLVGADRDTAAAKFGDVACVRFARGTHITLESGAQVAIEDLNIGDRVLTRDCGAQDIRWIGRNAVCGLGKLAPICIRAGALNNRRDLFVSPNHRILLRSGMAELSFGEGDVLVPAKALVNGTTIVRMPMLRADYLHLMLEEHDLVFSEGIATETLFAGNVTLSVLGTEAMAELNLIFPDFRDMHHSTSHMGLTLHEAHYLRSVSCSGVQAVPLDAG
jgi:hypothetical protein